MHMITELGARVERIPHAVHKLYVSSHGPGMDGKQGALGIDKHA